MLASNLAPTSPPVELSGSLETDGGRTIRLLHEIGHGGDATVFKAHYDDSAETVAVKIFDASVTRQERRLRRMRTETRIALTFKSPRVVATHAVGMVGDRHFIVMEYMPGGSLQQYLGAHAPLSLMEMKSLSLEVCEVVSDLHRHGVVHGDVKPHNILRASDGSLKIADFGLSRDLVDTEVTATSSTVGTIAYLAPEQAMGKPLGQYTDIYCLGVTLYVMATGRLPFEAATSFAVALAHVNEPPTPPSTLRADLPRALDAIVLRCLAKDPKRRYRSVHQLALALSSLRTDGRRASFARRPVLGRSILARRVWTGAAVFGR